MLKVDLDDGDLRAAFHKAEESLAGDIRRAVAIAATEGADAARARAPRKSGRLQSGIRADLRGISATEPTAWIVSDAPYSAYVEEGTKPHWIRPKAAKGFVGPLYESQSRRRSGRPRVVLRFEVGGTVFFRPVVHHPGTSPHPFMGPAYFKAEAVLQREIELALVRAQRFFE